MNKVIKKKIGIYIGIVFIIGVAVSVKFLFFTVKKIDARDYNLLVITLDTTRADHLGAYGHHTAQTPHIDFLAQNGVMFTRCYSPAPLTLAAHTSLFTGKYPPAHHVRDNGNYVLSDREVTLAGLMREKGYSTFAVIASYVLSGKFGLNRGFDVYDDSLNPRMLYNTIESEITASDVYSKYVQWFEKNHDRKFFMWVHFYDPHMPYHAPKEFAERFSRDMTGSYDAEVSYMDSVVGKIIDSLKSAGVLEKTIVVLCGDHGEGFGERGEFGHGIFCYDEFLNVPLIFYNPTLFPKGLKVTDRVNVIDVSPTLLDLYGIAGSAGMNGKSFSQLLTGGSEQSPRDCYFESMHGRDDRNWAPLTGMINGKYKYISLPEPELYDLEADKGETNNLALKLNRLAKDMDKKLMQYIASLELSGGGAALKRELTEEDKAHLKSLGYMSSFSDQSDQSDQSNNRNGTRMDPKKGIIIENRAKEILGMMEKGEIDRAEKELTRYVSQYPEVQEMTFGYDLRHRLYMGKNEPGKALEVLKEGTSKFPKDERLNLLVAHLLAAEGRIDEAEARCRAYLAVNPRFTRAYISIGEMEEGRKNIEGALENYKKALELEPQNIPLRLKIADLLIVKKDLNGALSIYNELMERQEVSEDTEMIFKAALFNSQLGHQEKAEQLLKQAIDRGPKGKFYFYYALILARNMKIQEALANMEIVLSRYKSELNPQQLEMARKAIDTWKRLE